MTLEEAIKHAQDVAENNSGTCEKCIQEHKQLAEWLEELKHLREQAERFQWVPTSERLPENKSGSEYYDSVIVTLDNGRVTEGCYVDRYEEWWVDAEDGEHYSINATGNVIAWMPLPEPYRGGDEK